MALNNGVGCCRENGKRTELRRLPRTAETNGIAEAAVNGGSGRSCGELPEIAETNGIAEAAVNGGSGQSCGELPEIAAAGIEHEAEKV